MDNIIDDLLKLRSLGLDKKFIALSMLLYEQTLF